MKCCFSILIPLFLVTQLHGQIQIYTEPAFPTADDDVTVYFDTSQYLENTNKVVNQMFANTGVITDASDSKEDWKYIVTNWKGAKSKCLMTSQVDGIYTLKFNIRDFYEIPMAEKVSQLVFEFRDENGQIIPSNPGSSTFHKPVYQSECDLYSRLLLPTTDLKPSLGETIDVFGIASQESELAIYDNGILLASNCGTSLNCSLNAEIGNHVVAFVANNESAKSIAYFEYQVEETNETTPSENDIDYESSTTSSDDVNLMLNNTSNELNFNISPNPSYGDISIYYQSNSKSPIQLNIIDLTGKQLYNEVITSFPGIHSKSLEMELQTGIYLVQLKLKDKPITQKLIIK